MSEITKAVAALRAAYPRQDFPDDSVRLYIRMLADLPADQVNAAIERLMRTSTWLPAIAEIRAEAVTAIVGLPSATEAWQLVLDRRTLAGPPEVRAALEAVGGPSAVRMSERPEFVRRAFVEEYTARAGRARDTANGTLAVPALTGPERAWGTLAERGQEIPESTSIRPRPVYARWLKRGLGDGSMYTGETRQAFAADETVLPPPTDAEKHDAILVLSLALPQHGLFEARHLHDEAQRIMDEASAA